MKQYVAIIKYKDGNQVSLLMSGTFEEVHVWVHNTLPIDNVDFIILQHIAVIETIKFEKNESEAKVVS